MKNLIKIIFLTIILNTGFSIAQFVENWESEYNGTGNGNDRPSGIAFDDFGNVYTSGSSKGLNTGNSDIAVVKYNANGVQQWVARYNGTANNSDDPYSIFIINNIIFVSGHTNGSPVLLQYDFDGNLLAEKDLSGYGYINLMLEDKMNNILAIGSHLDSVVIFKISSTGEILWGKNFLHPGTLNTICKSVRLADNGNILLSGGVNFADAWIAKFDSNGTNIWSKTYNSIFNNLESFDDITI
ncbi:MAG: hypothetical protein HOP31_08560, partial [Ignavibacteria bacterium]|nr:hypothetical protein [Ignavibacteria bacterium]